MAKLEFSVLGSLQVTRDGRVIGFESRAQRRILAALLVHAGAVVPVDRLIDILWGEEPPATARASLRTQVYRLRRRLGADGADERLLTRPPGYVLRADADEVDAGRVDALVARARRELPHQPEAALEALQQALALWRGPAFAEFPDAEFARAEARRLEELRLAATEDLLDAKLALGRHAEVVSDAEAFVAEHPLRERPHEQLILARYRCGQQARALETYRRFREGLDTELGLEPSERLRALETAVLRHGPELAWAPPAGATPSRPPEAVTAAKSRPGWLPPERTSLIGRADDVAAVADALAEHRAVCLVGVGGVGKSRLALRVARDTADLYPDGVWWCDLASVTAADAVVGSLATNLGVDRPTDKAVEAALTEALAGRRLLLLADNCEHLADEASRLLGVITDACPGVSVLATSRMALDLPGLRIRTVEPLAVPQDGAGDVEQVAAVRLFLERASAARAELEPGADELASITEICRRLDGLPLAVELAAARMRSLNAADLALRLDDRFRLLAAGSATDPRHGTLQAVVDWSVGLLSDAERRLFQRLSVFAGAFTVDAAEQVCASYPVEADEIIDLLGRLADASMVTVGPADGEVSYRLLETLRAYGRARLDPEETAGLERAHARYYVAFAEESGAGVRGPDEPGGVLRIERSFPNLREAHQWAVRHQDADVALRLPAALFRYGLWRLRDEVFRWAEAALEVEGAADHPQWPTVCGVAGWGCGLRGQRLRAARLAEQGLAAARPDDPGRVALAEAEGHIALWEGRLDECIAIMDRAAEFAAGSDELIPWTVRALALAYDERIDEAVTMARYAQAAADRLANPTMMALARYCLAEALLDRDPDQAAALLDHATELAGRVRNRMLLGVAGVSATALRARHGDTATALRSSAAVLDLWSQTSDWTHMWVGMRSLAELFARVGADRAAAVLLGAVRGADTAPPVFGADADRLADLEAALAQRLGDRELAGARSQGQTMGAADVLTFARAEIEQTVAPAG